MSLVNTFCCTEPFTINGIDCTDIKNLYSISNLCFRKSEQIPFFGIECHYRYCHKKIIRHKLKHILTLQIILFSLKNKSVFKTLQHFYIKFKVLMNNNMIFV